ncbi:MAG TPA: RHS repeat domain-containing protein [Kofleriaceae bacterium]|nr:RHS repeat domain-containing protein [Kofleriaceae bacterium]
MRFSVLLLAVGACAPHVMGASEWPSDAPPAAACEVVETYTDAMGPDRRISKYDTDGHLVFAQTRLTYDGNGFEKLTWKNGRVARIDSFYENAFRRGDCDVEGGCDEPAVRTIETSRYGYDSAGRLAITAYEKHEFHPNRAETRWIESDSEDRETSYEYEHGQLVAIEGGEMGDVELAWKNGHPVRRRYDKRTSTYEWSGDRLVMYRWFDYEQSFQYDAAGRLVREVLADKDGPPQTTEWTYDADGRVTSETQTTGTQVRPTVWTYDAQGRVATAAQDGRVNRTFEYGASCPANLRVVRAPTAEARAALGTCIRSPGYGYDDCFYTQR